MIANEHPTSRSAITGLHAVAVNVADQDRAIAFYVDMLGFELRFDADLGGGFRWIEVAPPGADTFIALTAATPELPAGSDTGIRLTTLDAEMMHAAMVANGVDVDELLRWPGIPPMFSFHDLDANTLYIMQTPDETVE
jgi:catechol 2,3-dioxygenase-like lactoylglutathione lyase family enzyme